jgi:hypothetical protein
MLRGYLYSFLANILNYCDNQARKALNISKTKLIFRISAVLTLSISINSFLFIGLKLFNKPFITSTAHNNLLPLTYFHLYQ